jgi:hypothetical protein
VWTEYPFSDHVPCTDDRGAPAAAREQAVADPHEGRRCAYARAIVTGYYNLLSPCQDKYTTAIDVYMYSVEGSQSVLCPEPNHRLVSSPTLMGVGLNPVTPSQVSHPGNAYLATVPQDADWHATIDTRGVQHLSSLLLVHPGMVITLSTTTP